MDNRASPYSIVIHAVAQTEGASADLREPVSGVEPFCPAVVVEHGQIDLGSMGGRRDAERPFHELRRDSFALPFFENVDLLQLERAGLRVGRRGAEWHHLRVADRL